MGDTTKCVLGEICSWSQGHQRFQICLLEGIIPINASHMLFGYLEGVTLDETGDINHSACAYSILSEILLPGKLSRFSKMLLCWSCNFLASNYASIHSCATVRHSDLLDPWGVLFYSEHFKKKPNPVSRRWSSSVRWLTVRCPKLRADCRHEVPTAHSQFMEPKTIICYISPSIDPHKKIYRRSIYCNVLKST